MKSIFKRYCLTHTYLSKYVAKKIETYLNYDFSVLFCFIIVCTLCSKRHG